LKSRIDTGEVCRIETVLWRPQVAAMNIDAIYLLEAVKYDHGIPVDAANPIEPGFLPARNALYRVGNACSKSHDLRSIADAKFPLRPLLPPSCLRFPRLFATDDVRANASRQNEQEKASSRP